MGVVSITHEGDFDDLETFLKNMKAHTLYDALDTFGQEGVGALELATPRETGVAAGSWYYDITETDGSVTISWKNFDTIESGAPLVILLQYGHATGTGGYVEGRDFINPALEKVYTHAITEVWKAVQS